MRGVNRNCVSNVLMYRRRRDPRPRATADDRARSETLARAFGLIRPGGSYEVAQTTDGMPVIHFSGPQGPYWFCKEPVWGSRR